MPGVSAGRPCQARSSAQTRWVSEASRMLAYRTTPTRVVTVFVIAVALAWVLTEIVWGATGGAVMGRTMARDQAFQQRFAAAEGPEARKALVEEVLSDVNWFALTAFVSAAVFGFVGFLTGLLARFWLHVGLIPLASFFTNNPLIRFQHAESLSSSEQAIIILGPQLAVCYGLAYFGFRLATRKKTLGQEMNRN